LIYIPTVGFFRGGGMSDITHEYAEVNGIRMHYARTGEGPHGGTHWVAEEFPGLVNESIPEFVGAPAAPVA
jgi:hypothetical protein